MNAKLNSLLQEHYEVNSRKIQLEREILALLQDVAEGEPSYTEDFTFTKTANKVQISHDDGFYWEFIRPDADVTISIIPRSAKARGGEAARGKSGRKLKPDADPRRRERYLKSKQK